jgi:hypothetical protein
MSTLVTAMPLGATLPATAPATAPSASRFTLDGDEALEAHLAAICSLVQAGVEQVVPRRTLAGILLGGGYGRGEGGVARTAAGDRPYNDMEFYVFVRGSRFLAEQRFTTELADLAHELSAQAGIEVEFKLASSEELRRGGVTMFSYDLAKGHRRISGAADLLAGCEHHERAADIPLAEATRLLLNRGSGLLFARPRLERLPCTAADLDFVGRNVAKAQLAMGDAVLAAHGQYHWSCRERQRRLAALTPVEPLRWLDAVRAEHAQGMAFKLRPEVTGDVDALHLSYHRVSDLLCAVFLWLESRRLGVNFHSPLQYAIHSAGKCPESRPLRNLLVNVRRFGPLAAIEARALRYPRERLLRALPVLLWEPTLLAVRPVMVRVESELRTEESDEAGLLAAYTRLWEIYR